MLVVGDGNLEWIEIKDELPPTYYTHIPILIWSSFCYVGYFRKYYNIWIDLHGKDIEDVTHWSVFPDGPNGEILVPKVFVEENNNA